MNESLKYIIPAVLGVIIGALLFKSCSEPEVVRVPGEVQRDTVTLPADTVYITETKTVYVEPTKPYAPVVDPSHCCEELTLCNQSWEELSYENWQLGNVRARGTLSLPWGSVDAEFSMPRYVQDEQDAFRFTATMEHTDSTQIEYKTRELTVWDDIGIGLSAGYGGGPNGIGPYVGVGLTYSPWRLSDVWR